MPYSAPKPQDIKARFPEFDAVPDAQIAFALEEACAVCDASWISRDRFISTALLTAHILAAAGALSGNAVTAALVGPVSSESLGDASWSFATKASVVGIGGLTAELAMTSYGQRFLQRMSASHPAVALC